MAIKAIARVGNAVRIIDQTALPTETVDKDLTDYRDVITAIKRLEVRGAPAIGIAAAYALPLAVAQAGDFSEEYLEKVARELKASRPTAVNLSWAVDRMLSVFGQAAVTSLEAALTVLWAEAEAIHDEDRKMCAAIGRFGAELIPDHAAILTHCNAGALATGGIGTALGVIYTACEQGKAVRVFADETRPLLQGARLTVWELQQAEIDVTLICDNVAGMLMKQGRIDLVIVGADRIAANGDTANKIGTYSVAVLAREHGIPFYVAAPESTFDPDIPDGTGIVIEERGAEEVTNGFGRQTAPPGTAVYSPAFDVTPVSLISAFITDQGVKSGGRLTRCD